MSLMDPPIRKTRDAYTLRGGSAARGKTIRGSGVGETTSPPPIEPDLNGGLHRPEPHRAEHGERARTHRGAQAGTGPRGRGQSSNS